MKSPAEIQQRKNIFLSMHPLQRILLSVLIAAITFFITRSANLRPMLTAAVLWDAFAFSFILMCWIIFFKRSVDEIISQANKDDGSRLFVLVCILISAFASLFTVLLLIISKDQPTGMELITIICSVTGMMFSWIMVHTIFTFHYAHLYYSAGKDDTPTDSALQFPGNKAPDYIDFAYFAFVIGMTFQVSDVAINSPTVRRTVLAHGLLSFALNTFVVALTINLIAGLK